MLYYNFKNYEEFKELFVRETNDGKKIRTNKIVLNTIKHPAWFRYNVKLAGINGTRINIPSLADVEKKFFNRMAEQKNYDGPNRFVLMGKVFVSYDYTIDSLGGLCADGDTKSVRYVNVERDKVFKMKAGKFFSAVVKDSMAAEYYPQSVINYFCGDVLPQMWEAYAKENIDSVQYELHVDDDFERIYDSYECVGNFHSCMVGCGYHVYYEDCVDASAAYLTNADEKIVARAIIFNKVFDDDGNEYRLCERQYSSDGDLSLQRMLVNKLIAGKLIDGYKQVGASCSDSLNFVLNDGTSLRHKPLHIVCDLGKGNENISYQDSFKYVNFCEGFAYNGSYKCHDADLSVTSGRIGEWDEYHERYCDRTVDVYCNGERISCDADNLDDFIKIDEDYYHKDDVETCDYCGEYYLREDSHYSEITDEYYCSSCCLEDAEDDYKETYWNWSDYDNKYFEDEDDVVSYKKMVLPAK